MLESLARLDPRARRTRQLLRETLIELTMERGEFQSITIKDIATRAEVSRTTFYLHFKTVDDLLFETMREQYMQIFARVHEPDVGLDIASGEDFKHVEENADFYRVMIGENGSPAFVNRVRSFLAQANVEWMQEHLPTEQESPIPIEMVGYFMAGAQIGIIAWWLKQNEGADFNPSAEVMGKMAATCCTMGVGQALGIDNFGAKTKP
jgi:AcrR family transcriptional regulator